MSAADHDPCCPIFDLPVQDCVVCSAIQEARGQEIETRNRIWRENLPLIERRWYLDGYTDGAAHHPPRYP